MNMTREFFRFLLRAATAGPARRVFAALVLPIITHLMAASIALGQDLTHGPVVGGVTASEANVFVRTSKAADVATLRYSTNPSFLDFAGSEAFTTDGTSDFTRIISLANLSPQTTYYLDVVVNGVPQLTYPYPSFTTFPESGSAVPFSFVVLTDFTSIPKLTATVQTYASAAATNPAFVFIGGDFDHRDPDALRDKRRMYKDLYDANTPFMADFVNLILRKTPIVHQWDDHDSGQNNIDKSYADWNLNQAVYQEYVPSYGLPSVTPGIWQTFSYAQADFFVLDCRSQRDSDLQPDDANKSMLDGHNLGARGQLLWLKFRLLASRAQWKIIFTSVITNPTTKFVDGWGGFQTEWNGLKDFINANNIQGVVFISGDLHVGAIDGGRASGFPEMTVAQPNSREVDDRCATAQIGKWSEGFYNDTCSGFGLVTIATDPDRLILQVNDEFGTPQIHYVVLAPATTRPQLRQQIKAPRPPTSE